MNRNYKARIMILVGVLVAAEFAVTVGVRSQTLLHAGAHDRVLEHPRQHRPDSRRSGLEIYLTELDG